MLYVPVVKFYILQCIRVTFCLNICRRSKFHFGKRLSMFFIFPQKDGVYVHVADEESLNQWEKKRYRVEKQVKFTKLKKPPKDAI